VFYNYFNKLFSSQSTTFQVSQQHNGEEASPIQDEYTTSVPDKQEIWNIVKNMRSDASPGPDGLNAGFYKVAWPWIADDVVHLVQQFYNSAELPQGINSTYIALISKTNAAHTPHQFRHISFVMSFTKSSLNL